MGGGIKPSGAVFSTGIYSIFAKFGELLVRINLSPNKAC